MDKKSDKSYNYSWCEFFNQEKNKSYFLKILDQLNQERKNKVVYPPDDLIFACFNYTNFNELLVVVLGQDPYHNPEQAHGLAFSVPNNLSLPPSLLNIFKEMQSDLQISVPKQGDLTYLAKQGVLLLNTSLTVEAYKPNSHKNLGWEEFIIATLKYINSNKKNIVFILWGNNAQKYASLINRENHMIIKSAHPSPFSAHKGFFGSKPFSKCNQYLEKHHNKTICWSQDI